MNIATTIALIGWLPVVVALLVLLPPRVAVAASFAFAWCFLPCAGYPLPGLPDYTKVSATNFAVLIGTLLFNSSALTAFRPRWVDLPVAVWCLVPFFSSVTNDLGAYDGLSASLNQTILWGVPYFIGRIYFARIEQVRDLAVPVLACALVYVPLCLYEVRMSPQLHNMLYGFHQHSFAQTIRGGGWRPMVFMNHGLMVAMWMGSALLLAAALWKIGGVRRMFGLPMWSIVAALAVTFILLKSAGALALIVIGAGAMWLAWKLKSALPIAAIAGCVVLYLAVRATGAWSGEGAIEISRWFSDERAGSLKVRMDNEDLLADRARQQPLFGWGGWGRNRVHDENGKDISVTDGMWIIAFGMNGAVGLASLYGMMLLGPTLLALRSQPAQWSIRPDLVLAAGVAIVCLLEAADSLPNAMPIPVITMAMGATAGIAVAREVFVARPAVPRRNSRAMQSSVATPLHTQS